MSTSTPLMLPPWQRLLQFVLSLSTFVMMCLLFLDRPLAVWLAVHAGHWVEPARAFTDNLSALFLPSLPRWVHPVALIVTGLLLAWQRRMLAARTLWLIALVLVLTRTTVSALKAACDRVRPFEYLNDPRLADFGVAGHDSFPSGHAGTYMAVLLPLALVLPQWRLPLLLVATLGSLARVVEGDHYLGDVTASTVIVLIHIVLVAALLGRPLGLRFSEPTSP